MEPGDTLRSHIGLRDPGRDYVLPDERALAALWRNAHSLSEGLVTRDGRRWQVLYPGRPGGSSGPDFRDAVLYDEEGRLVFGDVELHLGAEDWRRHGHHADPAYNGVVMHVVLKAGRDVATVLQSGAATPVVELEDALDALNAGRPGHDGLDAIDRLGARDLEDLLDAAGDLRFQGKSRGFALELESSEPDQVIYAALMESWGFSANRRPFRELAGAVPYSTLRRLRGEPSSTRLAAIRALLVHGSGLAGLGEDAKLPERALVGLRTASRRLAPGAWRTAGVRPANQPARRLEGAAAVLDRLLSRGLAVGLAQDLRESGARGLTKTLVVEQSIGIGRARDSVVNAVLPCLHALGAVRRDGNLAWLCLDEYRHYPKLSENGLTREMTRLLHTEEKGIQIAGARRQQGLIHLYKTSVARARADKGLG